MEDIIQAAKKTIPSINVILEQAWQNLNINPKSVKKHFGRSLVDLDTEATGIFRKHERASIIKLAKSWLNGQKEDVKKRFEQIAQYKKWDDFIEDASKMFVEFGLLVQSIEKDLGNMRKARGGRTFELMVIKLLNYIDIKSEMPSGKQKEKLQRIDIVVPDVNTALTKPDKAFFLTCKRTLRERWKQEVPQAKINQRFYLLTIDDSLSESKALEINEKQLIAFVRDEIFKNERIKKLPWIRNLNDLPLNIT